MEFNCNSAMKVGARFASFDELSAAMKALEKETMINFYIESSKTLKLAADIVPNIVSRANPSLKYYTIKYACIHGGRKFTSISKGIRPNQRFYLLLCV